MAAGIAIAAVGCLAIFGYFAQEAVEELIEGEMVASSLSPGEPVIIDNLKLTVDRYELSPGSESSPPSPGAQFLWIHLTAENVGQTPIEEWVSPRIEYRDAKVGTSWVYDHTHPKFDNFVKLFPGVGHEGWEAFEVPIDLDLAQIAVLVEVGLLAPKVAGWRLTAPGNANER